MAQFLFEADVHGLLKLDTLIPNAPPARWQRKAKESGPGLSPVGVSPMKPANRSHSSSKTPSKTPGKSGSRIQSYPTKAGGDRYIPSRSTMQMEMVNFLLAKENDPAEDSPTKKEQQKAWAVNLNGFDVEEAKILHLRGKPQNAPEAMIQGYQNNLNILYSQKMAPGFSRKKSRYIPSKSDWVLDAPEICDNYYLNLIDWSSQNFLAVALDNTVYLWNHATREIIPLLQMEHPDVYISSVSWIKDGDYLAVGTSSAEVQLWDVEQQKRLRTITSHCVRVGTLSWNSYILSSGARTGHIHHHDVRVAEHHVATLAGHTHEVCGLKWPLDGRYLASGGNDSLANVWPCTQGGDGDFSPVQTFTQHQGAVKAVAWCPWQMNVLATGGGTSDRHIRIWNVCSGACLSAVDTRSQVSSILWSTNYKELISGHGFAQNQLVIWKYPTMTKVAELQGHTDRILNLTMSPDGTAVASAAADETLRIWRCFEMDPIKKKKKEKAVVQNAALAPQDPRCGAVADVLLDVGLYADVRGQMAEDCADIVPLGWKLAAVAATVQLVWASLQGRRPQQGTAQAGKKQGKKAQKVGFPMFLCGQCGQLTGHVERAALDPLGRLKWTTVLAKDPPEMLRANPRYLRALELWQTDVTQIAKFGWLRYWSTLGTSKCVRPDLDRRDRIQLTGKMETVTNLKGIKRVNH
ncbi:cell division cycle protein 20 homolog [Melozone crissalis]|uniref:cell division cycle protein 20 homolog n=1 Tax=Melozone crissalis TaxID=40204 RepID=UPI0023DB5036|nr:cell division cycle protein 20 homolog [Melozone crissalis]